MMSCLCNSSKKIAFFQINFIFSVYETENLIYNNIQNYRVMFHPVKALPSARYNFMKEKDKREVYYVTE